MDDETLLRRYAREGDEATFRTLVARYGGLVYAACLRDLRRADLAEDAAQGVFLVLARKSGRIRVRTTLVPWLVATARLVSRSTLRTERRHLTVPLDESVPAPEALPDAALFAALDALNGPEREAVVLRFAQGLSLAEVGRAQGVSEDAARMRVNRALKRLRTEYVPSLAMPLSLAERLANLPIPKPMPILSPTLLIASGGIVTLATVGVASWRTMPASSPAPRATATAILAPTQPPTVNFATKPDTSRSTGAFPTLSRPFTLVYHCTKRDLRSQAALDEEAERYRRDAQREVDAGRMSPERMASNLAAVRVRQVPRERDVTLSYDGRTLLLACDGTTFLVQGARTFEFPAPGEHRIPALHNGYALWMTTVPMIGASLPGIPFVKDGWTLVEDAAPHPDGLPIYNPGKFEAKAGRIVRVVNKFPNERLPYGTTTLSDHRRVAGVEVAGRAVCLIQTQSARPVRLVESRLISASDRPLPADRFDIGSYLPDRTDFNVSNGRISRAFSYERGKGTLDAQIQAFLADGRW